MVKPSGSREKDQQTRPTFGSESGSLIGGRKVSL